MKLPLLQIHAGRRAFLLRQLWPAATAPTSPATAAAEADMPGPTKPSVSAVWVLLHALFCATSMAVGFRFARLLLFLVLLPPPSLGPTTRVSLLAPGVNVPNATDEGPHRHHGRSHVYVGRHPIRVRPWPHPDPAELLRAHRILAAVQQAQRRHRHAGATRPILAVTPTFPGAPQAAHLTSLAHTLRLVPGPLTWLVVEAGDRTDAVAALLARSGLQFVHLASSGARAAAQGEWATRRLAESRMRLLALREIRDRSMDGVVVFADDSNIHRVELFDEAQKVKSVGAVPVGILEHPENIAGIDIPVQAPACDSSGRLVGFHAFDTFLPANSTAQEHASVSRKLEWAGFVLSSRLLWKGGGEGRPEWVRDLDSIDDDIAGEIVSPLVLLNDASFVEPLANCSRKALSWWLRSEPLPDCRFPTGWKIDLSSIKTASPEQNPLPDMLLQNQTTTMSIKEDND